MKLSEVEFIKVSVGDKVISKLGNEGIIMEVIPIHLAHQREDNEFYIEWNNGNKSLCWHFECNYIEYVGKNND